MSSPAFEFNAEESRSLVYEVMHRSGQNLVACYQCRRCAAGCPVAQESGWVTPDRLIRMVVMGDTGGALSNELVWRCVSCYTCGERCPNDIQTSRITETLKQMAKDRGITALRPRVKHFHDAFTGTAVRWGKVNELELMGIYETKNSLDDLKRGDVKAIMNEMLSQLKFGLPMLTNRRLHFGFLKAKGRGEIKRLAKKAHEKRVEQAGG